MGSGGGVAGPADGGDDCGGDVGGDVGGPAVPHAARTRHRRTAARLGSGRGARRPRGARRAWGDVEPAGGVRRGFIGGIVAWGLQPGRGPGCTSFDRVAFLIGWLAVLECESLRVRFGPNPLGSILPPSERGADWAGAPLFYLCRDFRLSRLAPQGCVAGCAPRSRTFESVRSGAPRRLALDTPAATNAVGAVALPLGEPGCSPLCQNRTHGTDLVRADVHPPSWQRRGRRRGSLPGGGRANRSRDHRRDRHLLTSR